MVVTGEPCPPVEANAEPLAAQTLPNDDDADEGPSTVPTTSLLECHQEGDMADEFHQEGEIADEDPDDIQGNSKRAKYSVAVKESMYQKGLYNRHPLEHPLLQAFAMHLNKEKKIQNYKQEVRTIKYFPLFMRTAICTLTKGEATHS